jgi:hypothetical protein
MKDFSDINYSLPPSPNLEENLEISIFSDDNDNNCSSTAHRAQLVIYVIPLFGLYTVAKEVGNNLPLADCPLLWH